MTHDDITRRPAQEPPGPTEDEIARVLGVLTQQSAPIERLALARAANVKERTARKAVQALVFRQQPVITLNDGYRLTQDSAEIRAEIRSLKHRAGEILRRAAALQAWLDARGVQGDLFDGDEEP